MAARADFQGKLLTPPSTTSQNLQTVSEVPSRIRTSFRTIKARLTVDSLPSILDIELRTGANKVGVAIIFEPDHCRPEPHNRDHERRNLKKQ
ncbi:hypothetical protein [Bradyrhizobium sp. 164]|uniref:hypothetical protein n=1 Tax=Bradyrhizobium sp. 164 TaxID=2782637 RepID=UPI001FF9131C|nr:hypothetical protein [Bradyrhizobium sp. 164]MCK1593353.1 hypothetical protein [Bradyrhizobium sp. 164]